MKNYMLIVLVSCILLVGCGTSQTPEVNQESSKFAIYNPFEEKFMDYDKVNMTSEYSFIYPETNEFQYAFNTPCKYYVTGNSEKRNYQIIEYDNGKITTIYKLKEEEGEALFPLATDGERYFFLITTHEYKRGTYLTIAEFKDGNLIKYKNVKGNLTRGTIYKGLIYYTDYDTTKDSFELYTIDCNKYSNNPDILQVDLVSDDLFVLNDEVYISDKVNIYPRDKTSSNAMFNKSTVNYYDTNSNRLIQLEAFNNNMQTLKIVDPKTKDILLTLNNVYGIGFEKNNLKVYCEGLIMPWDYNDLSIKNIVSSHTCTYDKASTNYLQDSKSASSEYIFVNYSGEVEVWDIDIAKNMDLYLTVIKEVNEGKVEVLLLNKNTDSRIDVTDKDMVNLEKGEYRVILKGNGFAGTCRIEITDNEAILLKPFFRVWEK